MDEAFVEKVTQEGLVWRPPALAPPGAVPPTKGSRPPSDTSSVPKRLRLSQAPEKGAAA